MLFFFLPVWVCAFDKKLCWALLCDAMLCCVWSRDTCRKCRCSIFFSFLLRSLGHDGCVSRRLPRKTCPVLLVWVPMGLVGLHRSGWVWELESGYFRGHHTTCFSVDLQFSLRVFWKTCFGRRHRVPWKRNDRLFFDATKIS